MISIFSFLPQLFPKFSPTPLPRKLKKILIVSPSWIGDAVMSLSLCEAIAHHAPEARITVLGPASVLDVYRASPLVHDFLSFSLPRGTVGLLERWRYGQQLKSCDFDLAYILPNSWKSALVPFFARIPQRIGFIGEMRYRLLTHPQALPSLPPGLTRWPQAFLYHWLAHSLAVSRDPNTPQRLPQKILFPPLDGFPWTHFPLPHLPSPLSPPHSSSEAPVMALCPGAEYGPAKRWPAASYGELAKIYLQRGWKIWILGSQADRPWGEEIQRHSLQGHPASFAGKEDEFIVNWAGKTTLKEAIERLAHAHVVVTNDSGLMHVAAALNRPTVALFGSSDPYKTPPLSPQARVISLNLPCSPCFQRICPLKGTDHLSCLTQISPALVSERIDDLVNLSC